MKLVVSLTVGEEEVSKDLNLFHLATIELYTPLSKGCSCEYWKSRISMSKSKKRLYLRLTRILSCAYRVTVFGLVKIIGFGTSEIISPSAFFAARTCPLQLHLPPARQVGAFRKHIIKT